MTQAIVPIKDSDPERVSYYFSQGMLATVVEQVHRIQRWEEWLTHTLPQAMQPHCHVLNIRGRELIVGVDNATWGTRFRYLIPSLLSTSLEQKTGEAALISIRCRVLPNHAFLSHKKCA